MNHYQQRHDQLMTLFDQHAADWQTVMQDDYPPAFIEAILIDARTAYADLIPQMPDIGGDANHLTWGIIGAGRCLAFYRAMQKHGKSAPETGKILYDTTVLQSNRPRSPIPPDQWKTEAQLMERRRQRAARSQQRQYPADYIYTLEEGDGEDFDFGYNFTQCGVHQWFKALGAEEFTRYYCFLDYPKSRVNGLGLVRTRALSLGDDHCNHRFMHGRDAELVWPPPWLSED